MHRFTDRDIAKVKAELWTIITEIYISIFDFTPYIESKLITLHEGNVLSKEVKTQYPHIVTEPLCINLQPLVKIARERVAKSKEMSSFHGRAPRYNTYTYDWEYDMEYDSYYRRPYRDDYEY